MIYGHDSSPHKSSILRSVFELPDLVHVKRGTDIDKDGLSGLLDCPECRTLYAHTYAHTDVSASQTTLAIGSVGIRSIVLPC